MRRGTEQIDQDAKREILRVLKEQERVLHWIKEEAEALKIMLILHKDDKEKYTKAKAKLEFIAELVAVMNGKGEKK